MATAAAKDSVYAQMFPQSPAKGDERKLKVLRAAIDCIAKHGIEQASFGKIGQMAGMSPSHLNYYFKTKDELILAAIQYCVHNAQAMTVEMIAEKSTIRDKVKAKTEAAFAWAHRFPEQASVVLYFQYACTANPEFRALLAEARKTGHVRLVSLLTQEFGKKRTKQEIETVASLIHVATGGYLFDAIALGTLESSANLIKVGTQLVMNAYDAFAES